MRTLAPKLPCFPGQPEFRKEAGLRTDNLLTAVLLPGQEAGAALALGLRWEGATTSRGAGSWVCSPAPLLGRANPAAEPALWGSANFDSPSSLPKRAGQVLLRQGREGRLLSQGFSSARSS